MTERPVRCWRAASCGTRTSAGIRRSTASRFGIDAGESVALLGANGCGKSTLLKVLDGLLFARLGLVPTPSGPRSPRTTSRTNSSRARFRSRVGFIFQNSDAQVFSPTVRDELAFGPLNMGLDADAVVARVEDTLAMLDIVGLADRAPYQLSGGEKKRVAIASVLVMNPEVLLFDEPTAALDPRTQHWMVELIAELHDVGKTIVLATHDLETLPLVADRCIVLGEDHRVALDGPTDGRARRRRRCSGRRTSSTRTRISTPAPRRRTRTRTVRAPLMAGHARRAHAGGDPRRGRTGHSRPPGGARARSSTPAATTSPRPRS